jgi:hypothetical protein
VLTTAERRDEIDTYLTYPEWGIVFAYDDLAAVARRSSESDFGYFGRIRQFWTSMCAVKRIASSRGEISFEYDTMLYIIGFSFTAEMAIQGAYEETIGAAAAWVRGDARTPEDEFALSIEDDYARFLRRTPWYEYPFWSTLIRFWRETPFTHRNVVRSVERRIALSLQYGIKAPYAKAIGLLAGAAPAATRIRSVIADLREEDLSAEPRLHVVRREGTLTVVETPRYQELTEILLKLSARGRQVTDIAGNERILVTVLAPECRKTEGGRLLFTVAIATRPGWCRHALDLDVPGLSNA